MPDPCIALVTYDQAPDLTADDRLLRDALLARGARPVAVCWDSPTADWTGFDAVVLRSAWDYFQRPDDFLAWLDVVEAAGPIVLNPPSVVRWNADKRYLLELAEGGVSIVPTAVATEGVGLRDLLAENGWRDAVVKPAVSAGAHDTWRTSIDSDDETRFAASCAQANAMLVQPFLPEIVDDGEWSLMFVDGVFSHAAIKRAQAGDFRVQSAHGGQYAPADPAPALVAQAEHVLAVAASRLGVAPRELVYARVDGVVRRDPAGDQLLLMELEAIEPSLFFLQAPPAADRMADALLARIACRHPA